VDDPTTSTTEGFGLLYYGARFYDPALGRFCEAPPRGASADTLIPGAGSSQAWDRFAYGLNNPLRYIDPTGHFPILPILVLIGIAVLNGSTPRYGAGDAASFYDLVADGLQHEKHANIVGEGLQSLQPDPSVKSAQERLEARITSKPEYGNQAYSQNDVSDQFTANGPSGNWVVAAGTGNPAFWMVHSATISATKITVSADGTISTTWHIHDKFDFIPGPNHSDGYNFLASIIHPIYNGLLHAEETYPTDAYWDEIIPRHEKKSTQQ
jgi:RHS repeat-associated protein